MYFIAVACAANIALDYLFMGALHLGPSGAALGTTLSQTLSVILALIAIRKRDTGIRLTRSDLSPQTAVMGQILKSVFRSPCRMVLFRSPLSSLPSSLTGAVWKQRLQSVL